MRSNDKKAFYVEYMEKKKPKVPKCICKNTLHHLFGVISPSLVMMVSIGAKGESAANNYHEYCIKQLRYKCYKRILTKEEWKRLYRECRGKL